MQGKDTTSQSWKSNKVSNKCRQIFTYWNVTATLSMSSAFGDLYKLKCLFGRKSITKQKFAIFGRFYPTLCPGLCLIFLIFSAVITPAALQWNRIECMCSEELYLSTIQFPFPFRFKFRLRFYLISRERSLCVVIQCPNFSQFSCCTLY